MDFPAGWPSGLRKLAEQAVGPPGCTTQYMVDLRPPANVVSGIEAILSEHGAVVCHDDMVIVSFRCLYLPVVYVASVARSDSCHRPR